MKAKPGDWITIQGHKVGEAERHGRIIDVRGSDGGPPFMVQWGDDPGEHLLFPGSDAVVSRTRPG